MDEQLSLRKSERQEIVQRLGPQYQEFMDVFSRTLVQCPSHCFPIDILDSDERGHWVHFGIGAYPCVSHL